MKLELELEKAPKTLEQLEEEALAKEMEEMKNAEEDTNECTKAEEQFLFDMNNKAVQAAHNLTAGYLPPPQYIEEEDDVTTRKVKSSRTKKERSSKESRGGKKGSPKKERANSMLPGAQQLEGFKKDRSKSMIPGSQHDEFLTATPGKIKRERAVEFSPRF